MLGRNPCKIPYRTPSGNLYSHVYLYSHRAGSYIGSSVDTYAGTYMGSLSEIPMGIYTDSRMASYIGSCEGFYVGSHMGFFNGGQRPLFMAVFCKSSKRTDVYQRYKWRYKATCEQYGRLMRV